MKKRSMRCLQLTATHLEELEITRFEIYQIFCYKHRKFSKSCANIFRASNKKQRVKAVKHVTIVCKFEFLQVRTGYLNIKKYL